MSEFLEKISSKEFITGKITAQQCCLEFNQYHTIYVFLYPLKTENFYFLCFQYLWKEKRGEERKMVNDLHGSISWTFYTL